MVGRRVWLNVEVVLEDVVLDEGEEGLVDGGVHDELVEGHLHSRRQKPIERPSQEDHVPNVHPNLQSLPAVPPFTILRQEERTRTGTRRSQRT